VRSFNKSGLHLLEWVKGTTESEEALDFIV